MRVDAFGRGLGTAKRSAAIIISWAGGGALAHGRRRQIRVRVFRDARDGTSGVQQGFGGARVVGRRTCM